MLSAVKPRRARGLKQRSGNTLQKMGSSYHDRTTFTCSDLSRSLRYGNTRKSLDAMPRVYLVWRIWLSKPIAQSRRADSNRLPYSLRVIHNALQGCAGVCKTRIFKGVSLLRVAGCCTVLRPRWYQSGIKRGAAASRPCLRVTCTRRQSDTSTGTQAYS
jgi:hypothetical protein